MKKLLHSVVVPVFKSRSTLELLVRRIASVMGGRGIDYELILVDDGSPDDSFSEIVRLASIYPCIRGYRLSRNFGHQAAVTMGLQKCRGEYVAILDDDLQDPPELLPDMFEHLYQGWDVVYGVRKKRRENFLKRISFLAFYRLINAVSSLHIPKDAGDFCVIRRHVVDAVLAMYDANPFLRGARAWVGFRQMGYEYERGARLEGKSGYSLSKYFGLALTGIMMFSHVPLRLATIFGVLAAFFSFFLGLYMFVKWLFNPFDVPGYLSIFVVITFLGGIQLISIGIIGHYLGSLIETNRRWPVAIVAESVVGKGDEALR